MGEQIRAFHEKLMQLLMENEEIIETLRSSQPNAENLLNGLEDTFTVSKRSKSCSIEFLAENDAEIS